MRLLVVKGQDYGRRVAFGSRPADVRRMEPGARSGRRGEVVRRTASIIWSAGEKFLADDGWAIASYIGLTLLMSLFPFLIFVGAVAGFLGSAELAEEAARLVFAEWPDVVARPIAHEVANVLTAPRGGLLTFGAVLSFYFASSAIEALRVGLNRAYGLIERRPWWLLRLQSLGLVLVGSLALLALAFLVVLGPLILDALADFFPSLAAAHFVLNFARLGVAAFMLACRSSSPTGSCRPIGRVHRPPAGGPSDLRRQHRLRRGVRRLPERVRAQLHLDVCGPRLGHDRARLSLLGRAPVRVRRRTQRRDHPGARPGVVTVRQRAPRRAPDRGVGRRRRAGRRVGPQVARSAQT